METRTVIRLRTGTKICVLIGIALIAAGAYYYFIPVKIEGSSGIFGCGSAAHPPSGNFQTSTCQDITHINLFRTYLLVAVGLITVALGSWMFGVDRTTEVRRARIDIDETDDADDFDDADRVRAPRGRGRRKVEDAAEEYDADGAFDEESDEADAPRPARQARNRSRDED